MAYKYGYHIYHKTGEVTTFLQSKQLTRALRVSERLSDKTISKFWGDPRGFVKLLKPADTIAWLKGNVVAQTKIATDFGWGQEQTENTIKETKQKKKRRSDKKGEGGLKYVTRKGNIEKIASKAIDSASEF